MWTTAASSRLLAPPRDSICACILSGRDLGAEVAAQVAPRRRHGARARRPPGSVHRARPADGRSPVADEFVAVMSRISVAICRCRRRKTSGDEYHDVEPSVPRTGRHHSGHLAPHMPRVRRAQRLLETTTLSVERMATGCGFGSASAMREHFGRVVGTTRLAYRRTFAGRVTRRQRAT